MVTLAAALFLIYALIAAVGILLNWMARRNVKENLPEVFTFVCFSCQTKLEVKIEQFGSVPDCPNCGEPMTL